MTTSEINYEAIIERLRRPNGDITALLTDAADAIEQLLQENEDLLEVSAEALKAVMKKVTELERDNQRLSEEIQQFTKSDVVEVVRCKDCGRAEELGNPIQGSTFLVCKYHPFTPIAGRDDFCSYGVRKEGADNG